MAFVPVPDCLAVDVIYSWAGQRVENTLYFEKDVGVWTDVSILAWLDDLRALIETDLLPTLSNVIALVELVGTLLDAVDAIAVTLNVSPPVPGSQIGGAVPNNVTYTIQFKTLQRGRSFRGRNYVPGLPLSGISGNDITGGTRTALLDFYTAMQALASTNDITWVVVSRVSNGVEREVGVTTPVTTPATADNVLDSQRRRLPGRGT